ncbi:MAG TPA: hypothetical protein EYH31_06990, partial [Anaerolineae bacterium]|nr:hypothetical protein [Anaerolineae bacterium]
MKSSDTYDVSGDASLVCSAPGRAGIIGNPTDMYGGCVLSCSIPERARVRVAESPELVFQAWGQECRVRSWDDLRLRGDQFDIPRAVLSYLKLPPLTGRFAYNSEIPIRAGLAGSTALTVALLQAVLLRLGRAVHRYQLAEMARYIELHYLRVVCGY